MKKLLKKLKRGFTIVELVIVIAVIAILAAVLIPTLANLINNAEESNDMVLVSNLNKIVAAYDTVGDIETVNDALDGVLENGYSVSSLTPTSEGNVIVYDANSNRFALLSSDYSEVVYKDSTTVKDSYDAWDTSTTWVMVKTSDVSINNGYYDLTSKNTSFVLVGTEWNGKNVKSNYGVALYDYSNTVTLASVVLTNADPSAQKEAVKANVTSNNKKAIAKTPVGTNNNGTEINTIIVNVKAGYLSCTTSGYKYIIKNYSTTKLTAVSGCEFNEYGTTTIYDASSIEISGNKGSIVNYSNEISQDVIVNLSSGINVADILTDKTNSINVSAIFTTNKITVEISSGSITIKYDGSDISTTDSTGTITINLELGTETYPYLIASESDYEKLSKGEYCKLTAIIEAISAATISEDTEVILDLNSYSITSSASSTILVESGATLTISATGCNITNTDDDGCAITNKGTLAIEGGTLTGIDGIDNEGTATLNNVTISGKWGIYSYDTNGIITINNCKITGTNDGIDNYGTMVIDNSTINGGVLGIYNRDGILTVNSGTTIDGWDVGIFHCGGEAIINGGTISSTDYGAIENYDVMTINDVTITGNYTGIYNGYYYKTNEDGEITYESIGSLTINDGTITVSYVHKNSDDEYSGVGISNESGSVTISGGTVEAEYGVCNFDYLKMTGGTIKSVENCIEIFTGASADISGGTIEAKYEVETDGHSVDGIVVWNYPESETEDQKTTVTISGDVKIIASSNGEETAALVIYGNNQYSSYATVNISGGTFTSSNGDEPLVYAIGNYGGSVEIIGGTFNSYVYANGDCSLKISGGIFNYIIKNTSSNISDDNALIEIKGGTFSSEPASTFIDSGYTASSNGDGTYTVKSSS